MHEHLRLPHDLPCDASPQPEQNAMARVGRLLIQSVIRNPNSAIECPLSPPNNAPQSTAANTRSPPPPAPVAEKLPSSPNDFSPPSTRTPTPIPGAHVSA